MDAFGSQRVNIKPPERGVFALDHDKECKSFMTMYLSCLRKHRDDHYYCRNESKAYLECRMKCDLMVSEDLSGLGYNDEYMTLSGESRANAKNEVPKESTGFISGTGVRTTNKWKFW